MEDDPDIVDCMVEYLYRLDYDDQASSAHGYLTVHALVYAMAEKYEIMSLKELAKSKMAEAIKRGNWFLESFVQALQVIWATTPESDRGLRDQVIPVFMKHKEKMKKDKLFIEMIRSNGDLAVDIIQALLSGPKEE